MPSYLTRAALLLALLAPSTLNAPQVPIVPEIRSAGGVASFTLRSALDEAGRPAFFWNGVEVAPTIRVHRGDVIRIHYENALPVYCGLGMISDSNLHFHGLTTSPAPPGDEVIATKIAPHTVYDYAVTIGRHEAPGLYWYHPHPHGLSNWQIGNGMAGAIVVEGIADGLPELAGLRERVLILRDIPRDPSVAAALAQTKPRRTRAVTGVAAPVADEDRQGDTPCGVERDGRPTINGVPSASLGITPNERQLWRVLNASAQRHFDLAIQGVRLQVVAQDGFPLGYYPGGPRRRSVDHVVIPPGGRVEFVVAGPRYPQLLLSRCFEGGSAGEVDPAAVLGELVDDGGAARTARVAPPTGSRFIASRAALPPPAARRTIHFQEDAEHFYIDKQAYRPARAPAIVAHAGTTEEWTLENDTDEVHVFHIHQVHFAVESTDGVRNRAPQWRDSIDLAPQHAGRPSRTKVLVDFRDPVVRGTFLVHCHLADHEDGGMMAKVRVL